MKKRKLSLSSIELKSFITSIDKSAQNVIKGGKTVICLNTLPVNECLNLPQRTEAPFVCAQP